MKRTCIITYGRLKITSFALSKVFHVFKLTGESLSFFSVKVVQINDKT